VVVKRLNLNTGKNTFSTMEQFTKDSGEERIVGVKEFRSGLMEQSMKEIGQTTKLMGKANSGMQMVMSLTGSGQRIRLTDMEYIRTLTVQNTRASGNKICSMDKVEKSGKMVAAMTDHITRE